MDYPIPSISEYKKKKNLHSHEVPEDWVLIESTTTGILVKDSSEELYLRASRSNGQLNIINIGTEFRYLRGSDRKAVFIPPERFFWLHDGFEHDEKELVSLSDDGIELADSLPEPLAKKTDTMKNEDGKIRCGVLGVQGARVLRLREYGSEFEIYSRWIDGPDYRIDSKTVVKSLRVAVECYNRLLNQELSYAQTSGVDQR